MHDPDFWWQPPGFAAALLAPVAAIYGAISGGRMRKAGMKIGVPVICIGNFTVGGAGKTPAALAIGRWLIEAGRSVFFLSRGYGGDFEGPVRVDPARHGAAEVGDEPLLLARTAPTIVARDRVAGARMARAAGATAVVMDDGFQNPSLHKEFALVVVDGQRGIGNGRVFPAGPLRAPLAAQIERADALLVVGKISDAARPVLETASAHRIPLFHGELVPDDVVVAGLRGRRVLAFAGIASPEKFFATVAAAGIAAPVTRGFPDHHRYSAAEIEDLRARAAAVGLVLLTTEKDLARMTADEELAMKIDGIRALPVWLNIEKEAELHRLIAAKL
ncbi:MAG TPA: tetraacyldisaccharide 4'-kinase [Xanthobacteraceae bacterium]|nr:tetraacyldisaccharide 4'-kinase [Xanthobacteraceae bacterium]